MTKEERVRNYGLALLVGAIGLTAEKASWPIDKVSTNKSTAKTVCVVTGAGRCNMIQTSGSVGPPANQSNKLAKKQRGQEMKLNIQFLEFSALETSVES
jgi:hypothetical protein